MALHEDKLRLREGPEPDTDEAYTDEAYFGRVSTVSLAIQGLLSIPGLIRIVVYTSPNMRPMES